MLLVSSANPSLSSVEPVDAPEADRRREGLGDGWGEREAELSLRLCRPRLGRLDPEDLFRVCPFCLISSVFFGFFDREANHSWSVMWRMDVSSMGCEPSAADASLTEV